MIGSPEAKSKMEVSEMKKKIGSKLSLLAVPTLVLAAQASAHRVPVANDDPSLNYLRECKKGDVADGVAEYCARQGIPVPICVDKLKQQNAVEEAAKCNAKIKHPNSTVDPTIGDVDKTGTLHPYPLPSKELGVHWHTYSPDARREAGMENAAKKVQDLKNGKEDISKTLGSLAGAELAGAKVEGSSSETKKGPTQVEINERYYTAYIEGYNNPLETVRKEPTSATCIAGESYCRTTSGLMSDPDMNRRDTTYMPTSFSGTKEQWTILEQNHVPPPQPQPPTSVAPKDPAKDPDFAMPQSKDPKDAGVEPKPSPPADNNNPGKVEGPCGSNIKGFGICDYETAGYALSPLEECVQNETQKKKDLQIKTTEETEESSAELKKRAEEALDAGYCMPEWYGEKYCRDFNAKQILVIDPTNTPVPEPDLSNDPMLWTTIEPNPEPNPETDFDTGSSSNDICNDPNVDFLAKIEAGCP